MGPTSSYHRQTAEGTEINLLKWQRVFKSEEQLFSKKQSVEA